MSCIETVEPDVYGTRMVPEWYQGTSSEVPGKDRAGPLLLPFQMLMLLRWAFERGSVRASPVFQRFPEMFGPARTLALL